MSTWARASAFTSYEKKHGRWATEQTQCQQTKETRPHQFAHQLEESCFQNSFRNRVWETRFMLFRGDETR